MRYPDGGGLSERGRVKREAVRLRAAGWFAVDVPVREIAGRLRVSLTAVYGWRRRWCAGGEAALASTGPGGSRCRLSLTRLRWLADALDDGPAVDGFDDQRWTLVRVSDLIARMFHIRYTERGTAYLLHRIGFTVQVPARRAAVRDEQAIASWRREVWPVGKAVAAQRDAWICFEDEAGQTLRPSKARTWGRRGQTPVTVVSGKGSGRVSVAGLVCVKPGQRSRLIYRTIVHRGRRNERRSFAEADYISLLDAAHQQLAGPIVLVWDNLNTHISNLMRQMIAARPWLHVIRLPAYAPELNPTEGVWSHLKRSIGNLAVRGIDQLQAIVKHRLKRIQYRADLVDGFFAHTGLTLDTGST
jgi:putative transposase